MARVRKWGKRVSVPKPYKSGLEHRLHQTILRDFEYEPKACRIDYSVAHRYIPDFVKVDKGTGRTLVVESKGFFRQGDCKKYIAIRDQNASWMDLVFIFYKSNKPMPGARRKKDGSIYTMAAWAKKNGFEFIGEGEDLPKGWK